MADPKRKAYQLYRIAKYWNEAPSGFKDDDGKDLTVLEFLDININRPECFACHFSKSEQYEYCGEILSEAELKKEWNKHGLIRHHIEPVSLGGTDFISDIVLLCRSCHRKVPHVKGTTLKDFLLWTTTIERHSKQRIREFMETLTNLMKVYLSKEEYDYFCLFVCKNGDKLLDFFNEDDVCSLTDTSYDSLALHLIHKYKNTLKSNK